MKRRPPSLSSFRLWLVLWVAVSGCAAIEKEQYFAPGDQLDVRRPHAPEETYLHDNRAPNAVVLDRLGVRLSISPRMTSSSLLLFGPILPVIPVLGLFGDGGGGAGRDSVVLSLEVTPGDRKVLLRPAEFTLKSSSWDEPRTAVKLQIKRKEASTAEAYDKLEFLGRSNRVWMEDCMPDSLILPSPEYDFLVWSGGTTYSLLIHFGRRPADREPFALELAGITVNGNAVSPIHLEFVPRSGWSWAMVGP